MRDYGHLLFFLLALGIAGCGSSLVVPEDTDESFVPDGGIEGLSLLDASDNRRLPSACSSDPDCDDHDPCTTDRCSSGKCTFNMKNVELKAVSVSTPAPALDVALAPGFMYVAMGRDGVAVYGTDDAANPRLIQTIETTGDAVALDADERGVAVAEGESGMETFSAGDFRQRSQVLVGEGALSGIEDVHGIGIYSGYSIAAGYSDGVALFNLRTIQNPVAVSQVETQGRAVQAVSANDVFGLIADSLGGTAVIAYQSEEGPVVRAKIATDGRVVDVDMNADTGLTAEYGAGFGVLDLSDPYKPVRLARAPTGSEAVSCTLLGPQTAVVAEKSGRIVAYDLTDPIKPFILSVKDTKKPSLAVDSHADLAAVAHGSRGVSLLRTGCTP